MPSLTCSEDAKNITLLLDKEQAGAAHPATGTNAKLVFKWVKGSAVGGGPVAQTDFGPATAGDDPTPGGDVNLCIYEDDGLTFSMTAPLTGAGTWAEIKGKGWKYLDKGANGVQKVVMKGNAEAGKGVIVLLARGDSVPVPSLPRHPGGFVKDTTGLDRSYDIQLHIDGQDACHGMSYAIGSEPDVHVDKMKGDGVTPVGVWKIKRTGP